MKRTLFSILLVIVSFATARAEAWQWVIEGKTAGTNILFAPQQFIKNEHNFSNLFIGGDEAKGQSHPPTERCSTSDFATLQHSPI